MEPHHTLPLRYTHTRATSIRPQHRTTAYFPVDVEQIHTQPLCVYPHTCSWQVHAGLDYFAEPADIWSCGIVLVAMLAGGEL